jgi:hypothetical protein
MRREAAERTRTYRTKIMKISPKVLKSRDENVLKSFSFDTTQYRNTYGKNVRQAYDIHVLFFSTFVFDLFLGMSVEYLLFWPDS